MSETAPSHSNTGTKPTIYDVARHAGVSIATVSRVVNEHPDVADSMRERVVTSVRALDYRPDEMARSLGSLKATRSRRTSNTLASRQAVGAAILQDPPLPYGIRNHFHVCLIGFSDENWSASKQLQVVRSFTLRHLKNDISQLQALGSHIDGVLCALPGHHTGLSCLARITRGMGVPFVAVLDHDDATRETEALQSGADFVAVRPIDSDVLANRLHAWHRSHNNDTSDADGIENILELDRLRVDRLRRLLFVDGDQIDLSPKEFSILSLLAEHADTVCSRERISNRVWPLQNVDQRSINRHVYALRSKLEEYDLSKAIQTVHGKGYRLDTKEL